MVMARALLFVCLATGAAAFVEGPAKFLLPTVTQAKPAAVSAHRVMEVVDSFPAPASLANENQHTEGNAIKIADVAAALKAASTTATDETIGSAGGVAKTSRAQVMNTAAEAIEAAASALGMAASIMKADPAPAQPASSTENAKNTPTVDTILLDTNDIATPAANEDKAVDNKGAALADPSKPASVTSPAVVEKADPAPAQPASSTDSAKTTPAADSATKVAAKAPENLRPEVSPGIVSPETLRDDFAKELNEWATKALEEGSNPAREQVEQEGTKALKALVENANVQKAGTAAKVANHDVDMRDVMASSHSTKNTDAGDSGLAAYREAASAHVQALPEAKKALPASASQLNQEALAQINDEDDINGEGDIRREDDVLQDDEVAAVQDPTEEQIKSVTESRTGTDKALDETFSAVKELSDAQQQATKSVTDLRNKLVDLGTKEEAFGTKTKEQADTITTALATQRKAIAEESQKLYEKVQTEIKEKIDALAAAAGAEGGDETKPKEDETKPNEEETKPKEDETKPNEEETTPPQEEATTSA